jgi:hypothetical protein
MLFNQAPCCNSQFLAVDSNKKGQRRDYSRWPHFGLRRPLEPIQTFSTRHKPSEGVASVGILKSVLSKVKVNLS